MYRLKIPWSLEDLTAPTDAMKPIVYTDMFKTVLGEPFRNSIWSNLAQYQ
jgi:hypothetical protein